LLNLENFSKHFGAVRALDAVSLTIARGSIHALVAENGAGKSTLVKLIARMYEPTSGHITADGVDIARMPVPGWRTRLAGAFQDFFRFELRAITSVGVGDVARHDDAAAVGRAVDSAGATEMVDRALALPDV